MGGDLLADDASSAQVAARIRLRGERVDAYVAARRRRVNEPLAVDGDADVQFLVREVHEDEIARLHLAASDRLAEAELLAGRTRYMNAGAGRRVHNQSAAIESAGRCAAEAIRLAKHGGGGVDDVPALARQGTRDVRRARRAGGARPGG